MKKLVVLSLVLAMGSLASAALVLDDGLVQWNIEAGQLIGVGMATGTYDGFLDNSGLITAAGARPEAGNLAKIDDFGTVWNAHAEHLAIAGGVQTPGTWFVFDIIGTGNVTVYDAATFEPKASIFVPEPISLVLLGLGGLFLRRRS